MGTPIAVWPPRPTEEQLTVPRLTRDGLLVEGWCRRPAGGWTPKDLLWLPPSASKSTDIDGIGQIVDVTEYGLGEHDWVQAQLDRRSKYLDYIRQRVREGTYRLTAKLARLLGLPWDEDGAELMPRVVAGTLAARSLVEEGRRLLRQQPWPVDPDTGLPIIGGRA